MSRHFGSRPGSGRVFERRVQIVYERGLLEQYGAKAELARILGVTRQYVNNTLRRIEAKGTACHSELSAE
jgi:hypothetical protein